MSDFQRLCKIPYYLYQTDYNITDYKTNDFMYIEKPQLRGMYDCNYSKVIKSNSIKYFKLPKSYPIDLNEVMENYIFVTEDVLLKLYDVLKWAVTPECSKFRNGNGNSDRTRVYTKRKVLVEIMNLVYKKKDKVKILVSRFNEELYITSASDECVNHNPMMYHHHNLERLTFLDWKASVPNGNVIDENIRQSFIYTTTIGSYSVAYSNVIMGILADEEITNFDDLDSLGKMRCVFTKQINDRIYKNIQKIHKFHTWWMQAYLSNVRDLYIGKKNNLGIIENPLEYIKTSDLPKLYGFQPGLCVNFLHTFLANVEDVMKNVNNLETVYEFTVNFESRMINYRIHPDKSASSKFITSEYIDYMKENYY